MSSDYIPLRNIVRRFITMGECPYPQKTDDALLFMTGRNASTFLKKNGLMGQKNWSGLRSVLVKVGYTEPQLAVIKQGFMSVEGAV